MARTKEDLVATDTGGVASPVIDQTGAGVQKRGRGRPRSDKPKKEYVPTGRPRGRPKGTTKAPSDKAAAPKTGSEATNTRPARGRGRPRKSDAAPTASAPAKATPKGTRKRGRPSKKDLEEKTAAPVESDIVAKADSAESCKCHFLLLKFSKEDAMLTILIADDEDASADDIPANIDDRNP